MRKTYNHNSICATIICTISASEDYIATDLERIIYVSESQPASVMIPIIDDDILELNETFQVEIGILNDEDRTCVTLQPNVVNVIIVDDDSELNFTEWLCKTIIMTLYTTHNNNSCCNWLECV